MRKLGKIYACIIYFVLLLPMGIVYAQEQNSLEKITNVDLVIDQALDQVEKELVSEEEKKLTIESIGLEELNPAVIIEEEQKEFDSSDQKDIQEVYEAEIIPLETEVFKLKYAKAEKILTPIKKILTKNVGQARFDGSDNSIIATDTSVQMKRIKELVKTLDCVDKAIVIETKILRIILNDEHAMGVDWEAIVSEYQNMPFVGFPSELDVEKKGQLNLGVVTKEDYTILLEALDTVGVVDATVDDVLSTEDVTKKAISIISSQNEKVYFHLFPTLSRDGQITVAINPDVQDKVVNSLEGEAIVPVEDGSTIVIGSLFEEVMVESSWKIPLLGDLPLLGFVFRNQGEESRKAEMITFVTVKTVDKENDIQEIVYDEIVNDMKIQ